MPHPVVSVIVPAFRQASLIAATLDSVAAQTLREEVEVIVVEDGCPEGSGDVAAAHPLVPRVIRQSNQGVTAARNAGISVARGEYIAFLDADDQWLPEKLEIQVARLRRTREAALSFSAYLMVDDQGIEVPGGAQPGEFGDPGPRTLFRGNYIGCLTALVHRTCLKEVGGFPVSAALQRGGQDYALWLRLSLRFPLFYEPRVLAKYVQHGGNRVGLDTVRNFEGALNAIGAVWERDAALCERVLGRRFSTLVLRQARLACRRLVAEGNFERAAWARVAELVRESLRQGPQAHVAIWPQPLEPV